MDFVKFLAYGIKPARPRGSTKMNERRKGQGPSIQSVVQYYNVFQNVLLDRGTPIDPRVSEQVRKVCISSSLTVIDIELIPVIVYLSKFAQRARLPLQYSGSEMVKDCAFHPPWKTTLR